VGKIARTAFLMDFVILTSPKKKPRAEFALSNFWLCPWLSVSPLGRCETSSIVKAEPDILINCELLALIFCEFQFRES
jgi:hypothetical protein